MEKLRVGSLFAGIAGFDLGLEATDGFQTLFFVENNKYCQAVLKKHWPEVPIFNDVNEVHGGFKDDIWCEHCLPAIDVLVGGFPCQDISLAGSGEGIKGARSGLWIQFARLIGELRPRYVIIENVSALTTRGLDRVLVDLTEIGYDCEWDCIPASTVGAPHQRDRLWLVAYPQCVGSERRREPGDVVRPSSRTQEERYKRQWGRSAIVDSRSSRGGLSGDDANPDSGGCEVEWQPEQPKQQLSSGNVTNGLRETGQVSDPDSTGRQEQRGTGTAGTQQSSVEYGGEDVADPNPVRWSGRRGRGSEEDGWSEPEISGEGTIADPYRVRCEEGNERDRIDRTGRRENTAAGSDTRRETEAQSDVRGMADGLSEGLDRNLDPDPWFDGEWQDVERTVISVPNRVSRLKALGNSLVPQIPMWLGERILERERLR